MPRIDHLKNNPSKIPFPKQTRSSWSNASFHKSPIYYLSRSKINTLITARSIHPYTKTTFLRAVDKVTHHQTISINNQLDPPSTFLCSKKSEKEKKKKTVSRFDSPPFSSSNDPPTDSSIASKLFHPFPREAIDHKVTAASMTRTVLAFAIVQPATTHAIPSSYPRDRHILLPPSPPFSVHEQRWRVTLFLRIPLSCVARPATSRRIGGVFRGWPPRAPGTRAVARVFPQLAARDAMPSAENRASKAWTKREIRYDIIRFQCDPSSATMTRIGRLRSRIWNRVRDEKLLWLYVSSGWWVFSFFEENEDPR